MKSVSLRPDDLAIDAWQGDDFSLTVTLRDQDDQTPIDISTYTFTGQIRRNPGDPVDVELICTVTDGPNGVMTATATSAQTSPLSGRYVYDLQSDKSGSIRTYLAGVIHFGSEVTK